MKNTRDSDKKYRISQETLQAASITDCTGLIPAAPVTMEEYESYRDVYSFVPPYDEKEDIIHQP
ncbi:hypothetical protein [Hominifimenecus sp. rT4P-3]|uniref:hypothetical protein n=1 Tax=Hominifimenecus sp. rT4P-3 TaxID=3242979 RepID=UPI003DA5ED86